MRTYGLGAVALLVLAPTIGAQVQVNADDDWCRDRGDRDRGYFCEVREVTTEARASVAVNAGPNGGIVVDGWDRTDMRVRVRISARADTDEEARSLAKSVEMEWSGATIRANGPRARGDESWSASFEVSVPRRTDLRLETVNGRLGVESVTGRIMLRTTNGGIGLQGVGGDVSATTTNGGMAIELAGTSWDGAGLEARTTNGGITLSVPDGYSARLEAETTNGNMDFGFPVTVQGKLGKQIATDLGAGGAPIRAITQNGSVTVERR
jgi:DUF4097 and DUF4098 domain-containing protein YvlB